MLFMGLIIKPMSAGLLPKCTIELKIARFVSFFEEILPIRFAGFIPVIELTKLSLLILFSFNRSLFEK